MGFLQKELDGATCSLGGTRPASLGSAASDRPASLALSAGSGACPALPALGLRSHDRPASLANSNPDPDLAEDAGHGNFSRARDLRDKGLCERSPGPGIPASESGATRGERLPTFQNSGGCPAVLALPELPRALRKKRVWLPSRSFKVFCECNLLIQAVRDRKPWLAESIYRFNSAPPFKSRELFF